MVFSYHITAGVRGGIVSRKKYLWECIAHRAAPGHTPNATLNGVMGVFLVLFFFLEHTRENYVGVCSTHPMQGLACLATRTVVHGTQRWCCAWGAGRCVMTMSDYVYLSGFHTERPDALCNGQRVEER